MAKKVVVAALALLLLTGCLQRDVQRLAGNATAGRAAGSAGSAAARAYLVGELKPIARGLNAAASGDAAYLQPFAGGTNVVAVIPGTDLPDEYVMVGAHYDGLGASCAGLTAADRICNGATDNATGVAVALAIARDLAATPARRSVIIALWDGEESGLRGSRAFVANPLVPLARIKTYVNYDIQGANLLPSLRTSTIAVAAERGGPVLTSAVEAATAPGPLDTVLLSEVFGQGRSDHAPLLGAGVPSVFFTDSTGPCYHTAKDEPAIVDFTKLAAQAEQGVRLVRALATQAATATLTTGLPVVSFTDVQRLKTLVDRAVVDRARFAPADQTLALQIQEQLRVLLAEGAAAFDDVDQITVASAALQLVSMLTKGPCDGFLAPR